MKKILCIIILIICFMFLIPIFFTEIKLVETSVKLKEEIKQYDYSKYSRIKLLHKDTNKIEEVNLDEYIACVVSAEMPVNYEIEALKAQSIVARTYTIYKMTISRKHENADICDKSTCCQAWISKDKRLKKWDEEKAVENWSKIIEAVNNTAGKIITYNGTPINAFFHANSGGKTQIPFYVWGGTNYPYLQVVETSGEENYSQYNSQVNLTKKELIKKVKEKYNDFEINFNKKDCIKIIKRDESNRVETIKFGNLNLSGVETRTLLGLRSANFTIEIQKNDIIFKVIGYGHGVGMSQTGADALAKQGKTYEEIIKHYYKDIQIIDI